MNMSLKKHNGDKRHNTVHICGCITECIDKTDKARQLSNMNPSVFNAKERQFFLVLSSDDVLSKKAKSHLLPNIPLKPLFEAGLIRQTKDCINYKSMLMKNMSSSVSNEKLSDSVDPILQVISGNM